MNEPRIFTRNGITATLYLGDCREIAPTLSGIDAVITDPPYGIGFAAQPTIGQRAAGNKAEAWDDSSIDGLEELVSVAPILAVWGGNYYQFPPSRGWLSWYKPDAPPSMASIELAWTNQDQNSRQISWSIAATNPERVGHPTQKPIRVITWTMDQVGVQTGAMVFDPFMGSGTTGIACLRTNRNFIGVELDPKHYQTSCDRIQREVDQGVFF